MVFIMIKRALLSVSDKTGIVDFAQKLSLLGVEIISTGGTAKALGESGVKTIEVQDLTGFPECLDGRVKTLHPKIHGGLLAVRDDKNHMAQMQAQGVEMIDLVAVNLYPFKQTIEKPGAKLSDAIANIDIGGPAMLRSASKNYPYVIVLTDPGDYGHVLEMLERGEEVPVEQKYRFAVKAFEHTAAYDALIADYLRRAASEGKIDYPRQLTLTFERKQQMRYGENPHQSAAFYSEPIPAGGSLATYSQLHGKELSYNNIGDLDGALSLLAEFDEPAAVAVKHANPCGVATADNLPDAYLRAYESDTTSIYGGIVAVNRVIDVATAAELRKTFLEIIAAPGYDEDALKILSKKRNIRLMLIDAAAAARGRAGDALFVKKVGGGLLAQSSDNTVADMDNIQIVTHKKPSEKELGDLYFAMAVVKHTKSNAIVLAKDKATIGVGPGQNSRIMAAKIAIEIAGGRALSSVAASDAFFPLEDCVEAFAAAGVSAIIQPGGSVNDALSVEACNRHGIAMVFTGLRHFLH